VAREKSIQPALPFEKIPNSAINPASAVNELLTNADASFASISGSERTMLGHLVLGRFERPTDAVHGHGNSRSGIIRFFLKLFRIRPATDPAQLCEQTRAK